VPEDPLNIEFRRLLKKAGWTQTEAARQLSLTDGVISQYVSGETRPSMAIIKLFKLLIGDMTAGPPGHVLRDESSAAPLEEWERDLVTEIRRMDAEKQRPFVSHVQGLAKLIPKKQVSYRKGRNGNA
jgi:transcriptional regulator with XRE-family HTH domain